MTAGTISEFLESRRAIDAPALSSPGGTPLTYRGLRALWSPTLPPRSRRRAIGRRTTASASCSTTGRRWRRRFCAIGSAATAAPLNPTYRAEEFEFYLTDLAPSCSSSSTGKDSPAIGVAREARHPDRAADRDTPSAAPARSRWNSQRGSARRKSDRVGVRGTGRHRARAAHVRHDVASEDRAARAQRTSAASAANIRKTLALTASDRGLVIMPLFHIHGLIAGAARAAVGRRRSVLLAGLQRAQVLLLARRGQADLVHRRADDAPGDSARARREYQTSSRQSSLRFIRSSSSALPPTVIASWNDVFGVPVIEAYGMTEAAHQMASNPLAVRASREPWEAADRRFASSTRRATTCRAARTGEIVIKGPNVMTAYENNPKANAERSTTAGSAPATKA